MTENDQILYVIKRSLISNQFWLLSASIATSIKGWVAYIANRCILFDIEVGERPIVAVEWKSEDRCEDIFALDSLFVAREGHGGHHLRNGKCPPCNNGGVERRGAVARPEIGHPVRHPTDLDNHVAAYPEGHEVVAGLAELVRCSAVKCRRAPLVWQWSWTVADKLALEGLGRTAVVVANEQGDFRLTQVAGVRDGHVPCYLETFGVDVDFPPPRVIVGHQDGDGLLKQADRDGICGRVRVGGLGLVHGRAAVGCRLFVLGYGADVARVERAHSPVLGRVARPARSRGGSSLMTGSGWRL